MFERIVVAYDGTGAAEWALRRAVDLAEAFSSRVIVAMVEPPYSPAELAAYTDDGGFGLPVVPAPTGEDLELAQRWERHLDEARSFVEGSGVPCEVVHPTGQPTEEIVAIAEERDADLIVVGTREAGLVARLFGGSVSAGVAKKAHCDVLVVHPPR